MEVVSAVKVGRLTCGAQKGHGVVRHALEKDSYCWGTKNKALCGTQPGRRSVGFVADEGITEITCDRCARKVEQLGCQIVEVPTNR